MKPFIQWRKSMSVFIEEFDLHHQGIIDLINQLYEAMKQPGQAKMIEEKRNAIHGLLLEHFSAEETLLAEYDYPDLEHHQSLHRQMLADLEAIKTALRHGDMLPAIKILPVLVEYFHDHLIEEDGKYARYLKQHPRRRV